MKNQTLHDIDASLFTIGRPLIIIDSIGIIIGATFSILCLFRYIKESYLRTHYTYIVSSVYYTLKYIFSSI